MTYQVNKGSPHQCCNELCSILIFLYKKINHTRHRSSLFAKRHARLACSLASVLTDGSLPLPPFGDYACVANISMVRLSHVGMDFASFRFFYFYKKSVIRSVIPPFLQKGTLGSPVRLQACSLTAHCRCHLFASMPVAEYLYVLAFLFMFILLLYKNFYDIMILQINIIR